MDGSFIISLDFELHWGGAEKWDLIQKKDYFLNTRKVVLELLKLFDEYNIRVTWATVGFLFSPSLEELKSFFPSQQPMYENQELNYYKLFEGKQVGVNETDDPFHFANSLLNEIIKIKGQELASHTFCHYYCNEDGQTKEQFDLDLKATQDISVHLFNKKLKSLVFPRNQFNETYLSVIKENGYSVIRTNPKVWFWKSKNKLIFLARALDTLFSISKRLSFSDKEIISENGLVKLPASRFLRPYTEKEKVIQNIKIKRIKSEMYNAAINKEHYHLWWHPHNFGSFPKENLAQLKEILGYHRSLNQKYTFPSKNMGDFKK